jgi:uncharacterized protein DUF1501
VKTLLLNNRSHRNCEGVSRRDVLRVGTLSLLGLSLPQFLHMERALADPKNGRRDKNCILLFMNGGPSHIDTWDPKPDAPAEYRGEFNPVATNVDGIQISEHLPKMAQLADKYAIVRSLTSPEGSHERACHYMLTGQRILPTMEYPGYGSVLFRERGFKTTLPPYVAIPQTLRGGGPGYMGTVYQPFSVGDPGRGDFNVRDVNNPVGDERLKARAQLLRDQDAKFRQNDPDGTLGALDEFYQRAYDLVNSTDAKKAFNLSLEPDALKDRYGRTSLGMGCLLARRLVEAGTRFVTISFGGWDTHGQNFQNLRQRQLPPVDGAFSTLLSDLSDRGLLGDTLVLWMGEFGRTPKINKNAGRDHYPKCMSVVFAGGGAKCGQVVGKSDETASLPADRPVTPEDMAATIYHLLGVDGHKMYTTNTGRPMRIVEKGEVVRELVG